VIDRERERERERELKALLFPYETAVETRPPKTAHRTKSESEQAERGKTARQ